MNTNTPNHSHANLPAVESDEQDLKEEFAWVNPTTTPWPIVRAIILRALADNECPICAIAEAKERGEIKSPPRCPTHYDKSVLIELSVGGFRCKTCGQFVWPRETSTTTE